MLHTALLLTALVLCHQAVRAGLGLTKGPKPPIDPVGKHRDDKPTLQPHDVLVVAGNFTLNVRIHFISRDSCDSMFTKQRRIPRLPHFLSYICVLHIFTHNLPRIETGPICKLSDVRIKRRSLVSQARPFPLSLQQRRRRVERRHLGYISQYIKCTTQYCVRSRGF